MNSMDEKKINEQKEMNKLLWEWCKVRDKTHHDINYGSGDFYWEHMVAFGIWLKNKVTH